MNIFKIIKDIISPKKCYSCKQEWHFLCLKCLQNCKNFESECYICKNPSKNFEIHKDCWDWLYYQKVILLTHYKNPVIKKLITHAKFYINQKTLYLLTYQNKGKCEHKIKNRNKKS